ncbi:hypothetical protein HO173_000543 [Letharia columbiana]|uniref:Uncharacterized protein n=1 Tax=Letharia columbiana TaxID=112416 RepID=A0A8H6G7B1_9LECA|nr:uncharacterized protein HO173_000543 [Letharia columbiana]KAF6241831.1 hypothetical protein HO173_000543 [Letharia columbiana]
MSYRDPSPRGSTKTLWSRKSFHNRILLGRKASGGTDVGLWNGYKDFSIRDPSNYLELRHKAPPAVVLRTDQDFEYSREAVQAKCGTAFDSVDLSSFQRSIYENADEAHWYMNHGPGGLPDFNWTEEQDRFELEHQQTQRPLENTDHSPKTPSVSPLTSLHRPKAETTPVIVPNDSPQTPSEVITDRFATP